MPDSKRSLVIDCGNKVHLSEFERPIAPAPSNFVTKLRKHLKTRRLSLLQQVGTDRVLVFQFSDGLFYLVLEFFSAGNILLLDHDLKILALHRLVNDLGPENDKYAVNEVYKMFDLSLFDKAEPPQLEPIMPSQITDWIADHKEKLAVATSDKKKKVFSIHKLFFVNASYLSSDLILKTFAEAGIDASQSCLGLETDEDLLGKSTQALRQAQILYQALLEDAQNGTSQGVIVEKKNPLFNPEDKDSLEYTFDEFHPFTPYTTKPGLRFQTVKGYNQTLDQFFSTIESTKYALRIESQKQHAEKRLNNARSERDKQIQSLLTQQEVNEKRGNTIMYHAQLVEECKEYVQVMINKQVDWTDIENIIKFDAAKNKGRAGYFRLPLNLLENRIKLALPDPDAIPDESEKAASELESSGPDSDSSSDSDSDTEASDSDSDSGSDSDAESVESFELQKVKKQSGLKSKRQKIPTITVDIDLTLSSFANARLYFDTKKVAVSKQTKVEKSSGMALRNAEKKIQKDLARNLKSENDALRSIRPKYWFEKYYWFVTSDNYLCLAGRDDNQVDMIYYRHFSDNGYFVSSDMEGSLDVFILNPYPGEDVSPTTLFQAGIFAMLTSAAWNGKVSSSAWWLKGDEVTKKEFDNSLLGPGRLNFKGKKNFMPPAQLVMGFALYWLGDEETTAKYTASRTDRQSEHGLKIEINNKKKDLENITIQKPKDNIEREPAPKLRAEPDSVSETRPSSPNAEAPILNATKPANLSKSVRGKKGKMKKIIEKYADQDEEEKRLRMEALGTLKQVQELERKKIEESERQAELERTKYDAAKRGAQREQKAEERELQKYLEGYEDEEEVTYLEMLDSLIAKPGKSDKIATAVPVFAPWSALSNFKYKTKIQPGMAKKGKSVTESLNYFSNRKVDLLRDDVDVDWPEEHDIIKSLKSNDLIGVVSVNKLKLVLPGGNASDGKGKKGAKKGKK